jgi:hypothetical protein
MLQCSKSIIHQEFSMKRSRKELAGGSLDALYRRLDAVRMNSAERADAKLALAQADALASTLLAAADFAKRLLGARVLHPSSAHG